MCVSRLPDNQSAWASLQQQGQQQQQGMQQRQPLRCLPLMMAQAAAAGCPM
jgi:hypothetical protein